MSAPVAWLPQSALLEVRTAAPVAGVVADWSREWLSMGGLAAAPCWERCTSAIGATVLHPPEGDGTLRLVGMLLGREITDRHMRTPGDRAVVQELVSCAIDALRSVLARLLGNGSVSDGERFILPILTEDGLPVFRVEAGREALVGLAKRWAGPVRPDQPPATFRSTLDEQRLRLSARLGTSRLTLPEIETLAPGDVLVLDTPVPDAVDAWIDEQAAAPSALTVIPGEDTLKLQIARPASQW